MFSFAIIVKAYRLQIDMDLVTSFLEVPPVIVAYDLILNPTGMIDRCTMEDKLLIERLLTENRSNTCSLN
ncbi:hypothetical protein ASG93_10190 [Paenibacillus sp. Soil787]|nr:hypothetical protein ASG93_10190 [Paenibacillus sp. Soil787]